MKKNTMMRLASFLLIAVLISTSAISGTYAKYVTQDSASDSARVAKWGVTAMVDGSLFGGNYNAVDSTDGGNIISATYTGSVDSAKDAKGVNIVAPGTKSDKGLKIGVSGTPEVKTKVEITVDKAEKNTYSDIYLNAGTYGVMVLVDSQITEDNFKLSDDLYTVSGSTFTKVDDNATYQDSNVYYRLTDEVVLTEGYYPINWTVTPSVNGKITANQPIKKVEDLAKVIEAVAGTTTGEGDSAVTTFEYDSLTNLAEKVGSVTVQVVSDVVN